MNRTLLFLLLTLPAAYAQERVLDAFDTLEGWGVFPSEGVAATIHLVPGHRGQALRLDYDFQGKGGYVVVAKDFHRTVPENYRFRLWAKAAGTAGGPAPANDFEWKFKDDSGDNVWWHNRRRHVFPTDWAVYTTKQRHISQAWGPNPGPLRAFKSIELTIAAQEGGAGSVYFDALTFEPLPPDTPYTGTPAVRATSGTGAASLFDGDAATGWQTPRRAAQTLTVDFGRDREFGGLTLTWGDRPAADYDVETSLDGRTWQPGYTARGGNGGRDLLAMAESEARYLRFTLRAGPGQGFDLREVAVEPMDFAPTPTALLQRAARLAAPGRYPRSFQRSEQVYWTVLGADRDAEEALINEDGSVEVGAGRFSLEPFLWADGTLHSWATRKAGSPLNGVFYEPGWASVSRQHAGGWNVTTSAWVAGTDGASTLYVSYTVQRLGEMGDGGVRLYVALRPMQVNNPWQFLSVPGGAAPITDLRYQDGPMPTVQVDDRAVVALPAFVGDPLHPELLGGPADFGAVPFDGGDITDYLATDALPAAQAVRDPHRLASAALAYDLSIPAGQIVQVMLAVPMHPGAVLPHQGEDAVAAVRSAAATMGQTLETWRARVAHPATGIELASDAPGVQAEVAALNDAVHANHAYILVNRDGAAIQPGSRSYQRSWIRDGSLTNTALLRLGDTEPARAFLEWFVPYQFDNGKVPCCVDRRGADPVPEHDSHGQMIYLIAEYLRYTGDTTTASRYWPHVERAVGYMEFLRAQRMTAPYQTVDTLRAYFGLMPESISHEGYSAKPMHSFWDQLFGYRGYRDAAFLAHALRRPDAARYDSLRDAFGSILAASYRRTMAQRGIDYLPGAVELGDFDPTSTTILFDPVDAAGLVPRDALERTFDRYAAFVRDRRDGRRAWNDYTPYEWRNVGALVRLGRKDAALETLAFLMADSRPTGFRHWAEIVWRDPLAPRFIGDMPHTWVGSDFIRSALDLFAFTEGDSLVVGAGVPARWLPPPAEGTPASLHMRNLRTYYGRLSIRWTRPTADVVTVTFDGPLDRFPARGLVVRSPLDRPLRRVLVDGQPVAPTRPDALVLDRQPRTVDFLY